MNFVIPLQYRMSVFYLTNPSDDPVVYRMEYSFGYSVLVTNRESLLESFFFLIYAEA